VAILVVQKRRTNKPKLLLIFYIQTAPRIIQLQADSDADVEFSSKGIRGIKFMSDMVTQPIIRIQMDLSPEGVRNVLVYADNPADRDKALGWLNQILPQIELLEAALRKLSEESEPATTPVAGQ